ncbi:hypothetical protein N9F42_01670 [Pseudomonadales bacterium]|nr:hypothetical protein [Pseudomonadales bacterium]
MPSKKKIADYYDRSLWINKTLESMIASGDIEQGLEANNVKNILKTNRVSNIFLLDVMSSQKKIGFLSFWVTKKAVDIDFNTVSKMVARKKL